MSQEKLTLEKGLTNPPVHESNR